MTDRSVTLDDEAYRLLNARRCEGESFSGVVKRLADEQSWREVAGIWSDEPEDGPDLQTLLQEGRERSRERTARNADVFE